MYPLVTRVIFTKKVREATINRKTSNIRRTLSGYKIVDHSDVVGASPVGATQTTSSFSYIRDLTVIQFSTSPQFYGC